MSRAHAYVQINRLATSAVFFAQAMWQLSNEELLAAWQPLPRVTQLQDQQPFPRESRIVFREHDHKYFVDGTLVPRSVTGLLHEYSSPFDPARALASMKRGREWEAKRQEMEEQGLGTLDEEILSRWSRNGTVASRRGQLLHHHAECLLNGLAVESLIHLSSSRSIKYITHSSCREWCHTALNSASSIVACAWLAK